MDMDIVHHPYVFNRLTTDGKGASVVLGSETRSRTRRSWILGESPSLDTSSSAVPPGAMPSSSASSPWPPLTLPLADLTAGSLAGAAQVTVGQPLDTVRIRMQTAPVGTFNGTWDVLSKTVRYEGPLGLFKGMLSPLLGIAAQNSLLFTAFAMAKRVVSPNSTQLTIAQTAAAGSVAGGVNAILASPVELFKIRMQTQYAHGTGSKQDGTRKLSVVARDVWQQHGFTRGVMRGFTVTVLREVPAYAGFYAGFETGNKLFRSRLYPSLPKDQPLPVLCLMASGSLGGICNWLACYPIDVVKSRVQQSTEPLPRGYIIHYFKHIHATEGTAAFFRGLSPTLLRAVPAAAATFTTYELAKKYLTG